MKAVVWHGPRDVRVDEVPDPTIQEPTDAIVRMTTTGLCGSDLHLYEPMAAYMTAGDIIGHEPMGIVEAVGSAVTDLSVGDRVVMPFQIACGSCVNCQRGLQTQCDVTQVREEGCGAMLYGYTKLYGQVPGAQAELLRVPRADYNPIRVPEGPPDDRFVYLSDVLPTAWQAVEYADVPDGGTVAVLGLGPIGDMACRIALHRGARQVIGIDLVPDRLARAADRGVQTLDLTEHDDIAETVAELTGGRGPDSVIDAVGMEAHGSPVTKLAHRLTSLLPDAIAEPFMDTAGVDRLGALLPAIDMCSRGGTLSLIGVYGGMKDPLPMMTMFDKQLTVRMGQANVKRWVDDIMPLLTDDDPLGVDDFATHRLPLSEAPKAYDRFRDKEDGVVKVVFQP
jgi:threonine dehydrogenase-like Zn-dependent dehydrogenase